MIINRLQHVTGFLKIESVYRYIFFFLKTVEKSMCTLWKHLPRFNIYTVPKIGYVCSNFTGTGTVRCFLLTFYAVIIHVHLSQYYGNPRWRIDVVNCRRITRLINVITIITHTREKQRACNTCVYEISFLWDPKCVYFILLSWRVIVLNIIIRLSERYLDMGKSQNKSVNFMFFMKLQKTYNMKT